MAISPKFSYKSLQEKAKEIQAISSDIDKLFNRFKTHDFELVLRLVWQSSIVNESIGFKENKTRETYIEIRDSLIKAVQAINPCFQDVSKHMENICLFLKNFDTVISLNYDLIVYWAMIHNVKKEKTCQWDRHTFKDCFIKGELDKDWQRLRKPIRDQKSCTLVFYPHGSLHLARNLTGQEIKIECDFDNRLDLLESIKHKWKEKDFIPIFISEGETEQKVAAIQRSHYLSTVYWEVLGEKRKSLTIYGWSLGNQDQHLLKRMAGSGIERVAISVYTDKHNDIEEDLSRIQKTIKTHLGNKVDIKFFDSNSPGCWIHPPSSTDEE